MEVCSVLLGKTYLTLCCVNFISLGCNNIFYFEQSINYLFIRIKFILSCHHFISKAPRGRKPTHDVYLRLLFYKWFHLCLYVCELFSDMLKFYHNIFFPCPCSCFSIMSLFVSAFSVHVLLHFLPPLLCFAASSYFAMVTTADPEHLSHLHHFIQYLIGSSQIKRSNCV